MSVSVAFTKKCRQRLSLPASRHIIAGSSQAINGTATAFGSYAAASSAGRSCSSPAADRRTQRLRRRRPGARALDGARRRDDGAMPSFAHSSSRRSTCDGWRRRPVSPISPNAASPSRTGTPRAADAIASATARSAPGSSMRTPPATLTNTSAAGERDSRVPPEHRDDHREPLRVDPRADAPRHREIGRARRAPGSRAGAAASPRARTRRQRRPLPGGSSRRAPTDPARPRGRPTVISKTPSSFVEPKRFFVARSTRCSR